MRTAAVLFMASFLLAGTVGLPSAAAATPSFTMPDVRDMSLYRAQKVIQAAAGNVKVQFVTRNLKGYPQDQINLTNWDVCRSSPGPGGTARQRNAKTPARVVLLVVRPTEGCR
ncbi:PASTA domain-containing protein [Mycolicibacterium palauense]|uniref:hypothetical protein n=1 Tax=Mycolicibacterium palauense TaxID=2034511 RepID=UPI0011459F3F|nr:hypothetical protein [Mycolicibacterium palauense]